MSSGMHAPTGPLRRRLRGSHVAGLALVVGLALLAGCGKSKDKPASQTAAKVNKEEITVHQINFMLQQQGRAIPPAQAASASHQVLERLIDQELALQKAQDLKLDRDSRVIQQLEAARRDVIARAYVESVSSGAQRPTAEEIKAYYEGHPELFKQRRVYNFQELLIEAKPEQVPALQAKLGEAKDLSDFIAFLRSADYKFASKQAIRAAEQLPLNAVGRIAQMKDGQGTLTAVSGGAQVVWLVQSRAQPVEEAQATPAIDRYLLNERKRKLVEDNLKALRQSARIQYVGDYAAGAPADPAPAAAPAASAAPFTSITEPGASSSPLTAEPATEVEPAAPVTAASSPAAGTVEKGIKGLK